MGEALLTSAVATASRMTTTRGVNHGSRFRSAHTGLHSMHGMGGMGHGMGGMGHGGGHGR